ncbi:helix-turn-helix transcriptional regulator [Micromonospora okii]|uniref:helix-turn-helix transcriptional regulator n=1 Tax=Micromonospora okii TaxID=1182970 RepID=UPI001E51990F|nr:LuxR family transcriptional regulator [Micromonospora okii]
MASDVDRAPLVGRAEQLATLRSALLDDVGPGQTAAVFVTGESGVGKTRLLREAGQRLRAGGALVLTGACLDIGDASPLHPLLQALRRFDAELAASHARTSSAVGGLLRMFAEETAGPDGAGALLERVSRGLHLIAEGRPLVLVLDDLQWVDRSTRQLLLYLLAGLGDLQLSVLAAVRAESLQGAHPLRRVLTELRRLRSVRVLDLAPLGRADTERLATEIVGGPLAPEAAESVWQRSGGNPFVVEELARDVRDGRDGVSDTVREVFLSRVDALPEPAHAVVHAVAVGVEPVAHWLLAEVTRLPEEELLDAVRAAVAHRLLVGDDDGYRLRHRLVAEVLAHELLPAERAALHRRYAEALTSAPAELHHARLAHHWRLAGEPGLALPAAVAAAREAERLHGYAEAHRHWSAALQLAAAPATGSSAAAGPLDVDRAELLRNAAEAAHHCGEHARALTLVEELAARPDALTACALHIQRARYLAAAGRSAPAEAEYRRALAAADCSPRERATAAAHLAELLLHLGRYADAGNVAREALTLAAEVEGSVSEVVLASMALGFSEAYLEDPDAGLAVMREALDTAERAGRPEDVACAYLHLAELLTGPLNILEEGVVVARRGAERVAELGLGRTYETRLLAIATNGLFRVGQWAEAEKVVAAALRHRPSGADAVELLLARCRLSVGYGDVVAADRDLEAVATVLAGGGARHVIPMLTLRSGLAMWQGRHDLARQAVQRGLTESRSDDVGILAALVWHGLRAEAEAHASRAVPVDATAVRRLREVAERVARKSEHAARPVRDVVDGFLTLCEAEVSRLDRSDPQLWARSVAEWDRRNHPYPEAYSRLRQAEALLARRSRTATAGRLLRESYRIAQALGAEPLSAEIRTLASRARVSLGERGGSAEGRPATGGGSAGDELAALTAREREVLEAVAEGLTNREIGQRLFISERTIGVHVSHIFDKLQVRTRVQASAIFLRSRAE